MTLASTWLPRVPQDWSIGRVGHVADTWTSNVDKHSVESERAVRLCNYTDVYKNDTISAHLEFMKATARLDQIARFQLRVGDTLITKDSETAEDIGVPAFVEYEAPDLLCGYHLAIIRPQQRRVAPKYLYWVMASQPTLRQWAVLASGVTRVGIRSGDLSKASIPIPPLAQQRAIADYLDRETAKIDTLIEEQQRLIELLRERRRGVVHHLLTPNDGWSKQRIKHVASTNLGKMLDGGRPIRPDETVTPYVRAADVRADGSVNLNDLNEMPFSAEELRHFDLRSGDILVIEGGATVGRPGFLHDDAPGVAFQKTVNRVRVRGDTDARFVYWSLLTLYDSDFYSNYYGAVSFVHLTGEKLREIPSSLPLPEEQRRIARHLDEATAKIDALIEETERFIELSRERRAALITAAVTGQVDVRDEVGEGAA